MKGCPRTSGGKLTAKSTIKDMLTDRNLLVNSKGLVYRTFAF